MGVFYFFKIVQMVPNRAKHLIFKNFQALCLPPYGVEGHLKKESYTLILDPDFEYF